MKIALALSALLLLVACGERAVVTSVRHTVVMPQESMFNCNVIDVFPEPATLTDLQVARLLIQLYENNVGCKNSMDALRRFLETARAS